MFAAKGKTELVYRSDLFAKTENVRFDIVHPERREIAVTTEKPWEGCACTYHSVLFDPATARYLLYYRGMPIPDGADVYTCVAVSRDGITFEKPELGIFDIGDNGKNNIVMAGDGAVCHNFAPFWDDNPDCPKEERFKAVAGLNNTGLFGFVSADGFHWKKLSENAILTDGAFDSLNTAFYDKNAGCYRCYSRYFSKGGYNGFRAIQSCTSPDFLHWSEQTPNRYHIHSASNQHLYTNSTRPIPETDYLISTPMRFQPDRKRVEAHPEQGVSDCLLMLSQNGVDWDIPFIKPWIYPSLDERVWTQRNFIISAGFAETGDAFSFYVCEHYTWDDNRLTRYATPKYRFASAYSEDGFLMTAPFTAQDNELTINFSTSAYGTLTVSLTEPDGRAIEGTTRALYGNSVAERLTFDGIAGKTVCLSFRLQDAFLYAIGG